MCQPVGPSHSACLSPSPDLSPLGTLHHAAWIPQKPASVGLQGHDPPSSQEFCFSPVAAARLPHVVPRPLHALLVVSGSGPRNSASYCPSLPVPLWALPAPGSSTFVSCLGHKHGWPVFRAIPSSTGQRAHLTQVLSSVLTRWDLESLSRPLPLLECACSGAWRSPVEISFHFNTCAPARPTTQGTLFPGAGRILARLHRARQTQQSSQGF